MPGEEFKTINLKLHETKADPSAIAQSKIVSAYGLRKCPKLVEQIADPESLEVRVNALIALCDELNDPQSVYGCAEANVVPILSGMITDKDYSTRLYASKALAVMSKDANGLDAILRDEIISEILLGCSDPSEEVRSNVFECLQQITRTADGVDACNAAGATKIFVDAIRSEGDAIRRILLPALYNVAGSDAGLVETLAAGAVEVCVQLLDSLDVVVVGAAARALGFICLDERGKQDALDHCAVEKLTNILIRNTLNKNNHDQAVKEGKLKSSRDQASKTLLAPSVKASLLMALTSITSTDEGKRQCNQDNIIDTIIELLYEADEDCGGAGSGGRLIQLNILKIISNIAVHPMIRKKLLEQKDDRFLKKLQQIQSGADTFLHRHADIAISAVRWKP